MIDSSLWKPENQEQKTDILAQQSGRANPFFLHFLFYIVPHCVRRCPATVGGDTTQSALSNANVFSTNTPGNNV